MRARSKWFAFAASAAIIAAGCTAAGAGPRGLPTPRPDELRQSGTVSVFPAPGTPAVSPATTISFRDIAPKSLGKVRVYGNDTGEHKGHLVAHSDGRGASFVPNTPFAEGEVVSVYTELNVRHGQRGEFTYTVARPAPFFTPNVPPKTPTSASGTPATPLSFASRPDLHPPPITVSKLLPGTANGDIFLTPNPSLGEQTKAQAGPMIVDGSGRLVWFDPTDATSALDLSVKEFQGRPVLSFFDGKIATGGYGLSGAFVLLDDTYKGVARIQAGNGYNTDLHDFQITPNNTALVLAYNPVIASAATIGRVYNRSVIDTVIQEIDIPTGAVLFEWHSLGNIELSESYLPVPDNPAEPYDYVHPNSVALDADGNIWLSARHTWTVYKIDHDTGAMYWRLGGKRDNFEITSDAKFSWQHDARPRGNGVLSVFDNAASAPGVTSHDTSRGLILNVDEQAMKVTLERDDENPQGALSLSQGDFQQLPNGDWLAGWGSIGQYTEFSPSGETLTDANIGFGSSSYRAFRFVWRGHPTDPPAAVANTDGGSLVVSASWNGATEVAGWQVLTGPDQNTLAPAGSFARTGFETTMRVPDTDDAPVIEVQAVGPAGRVLGTSKPVSVP